MFTKPTDFADPSMQQAFQTYLDDIATLPSDVEPYPFDEISAAQAICNNCALEDSQYTAIDTQCLG